MLNHVHVDCRAPASTGTSQTAQATFHLPLKAQFSSTARPAVPCRYLPHPPARVSPSTEIPPISVPVPDHRTCIALPHTSATPQANSQRGPRAHSAAAAAAAKSPPTPILKRRIYTCAPMTAPVLTCTPPPATALPCETRPLGATAPPAIPLMGRSASIGAPISFSDLSVKPSRFCESGAASNRQRIN